MDQKATTRPTAKTRIWVMSQLTASLPPTNPANVAYSSLILYIYIYIYTHIRTYRLDKFPKRLVALLPVVPDQLAAEVRLFDNAGEGFADVWGYFVLEP